MNFIEFFGMYILCTFIIVVLYFIFVRLFIKKKCNIVSKVAEKAIDDYFNAYDFPQDWEKLQEVDNADHTNG